MNVSDIRNYFINELNNENFVVDKTGAKTLELLGASFLADEPAIFGIPNKEYIDKELKWYTSGSTNINDIYGDERDPPAAWQYAADKLGVINSNYGHLIFSDQYHQQYDQVLTELSKNPDGRRASMIYNRPEIWNEYDKNGRSDFICTNTVTYYIRDDKLHSVVQMRSNDVVFGYKNDYAWQQYILDGLADESGLAIPAGDIHWQVQSLHIYEKHFKLVKEIL